MKKTEIFSLAIDVMGADKGPGIIINGADIISKKFKINFKFNDKFPINSLYLMRGVLVIEEDKVNKYIDNFFNAYWSLNLDLSNDEVVGNILDKLNIDRKIFYEKINDQKIKDLLKHLTQEAYDREIFGAPTFSVNKKIFWGQDRLDYALDELKNSI